jgi:CheY-like chemotaxis protein
VELEKQTLEQLGYVVLQASNGCEAVEIIEQHAGEMRPSKAKGARLDNQRWRSRLRSSPLSNP